MDNVFRVLTLCTLLLGCAAEQARDVPLGDLACDEDDDCEHEWRDWTAVCSEHICKIRSSRLFGSPRRRCRHAD